MHKRIGQFLIEKGAISEQQLGEILSYSRKTGLRLGDAAIAMGLLTREKLIEIFGPNFTIDFFHLDPQFFPTVTRDLLPAEALLRLGMLPLGFKTERKIFRSRKILNIGLLDPNRREAIAEIGEAVARKFGPGYMQGTHIYLILADQFLAVMNEVYRIGDPELRRLDRSVLDSTLTLFLETAPCP
jgi:hypothetical protein